MHRIKRISRKVAAAIGRTHRKNAMGLGGQYRKGTVVDDRKDDHSKVTKGRGAKGKGDHRRRKGRGATTEGRKREKRRKYTG